MKLEKSQKKVSKLFSLQMNSLMHNRQPYTLYTHTKTSKSVFVAYELLIK